MRRTLPLGGRVVLALLVSVALWSSGQFLVRMAQLDARSRGRHDLARYEARFDELRKMLPPRGVVGYVSDKPHAVREYYLTQYALAPVIVEGTSARPLVVGNFFDARAAAQIAGSQKLVMLKDFGKGVMLFRGEAP